MAGVELIGIAGASGVGKSTVARSIREQFPEVVEVVHFDDFQKSNKDINEELGNIENWDDPRVTDFDNAYIKLAALARGEEIELEVKNEFDNPDFIAKHIFVRYPKKVLPKELAIVEGHYSFYDERIRNLFSISIFLKGNLEVSTLRRTKGTDSDYNEQFLLPMFHRHIAPLESLATHVINTDGLNQTDVTKLVYTILSASLKN